MATPSFIFAFREVNMSYYRRKTYQIKECLSCLK